MTKKAERTQKLLTMALSAFSSGQNAGDKTMTLKNTKNKYVLALKRYIIQDQVQKVRERLQSSPTYHALLQEQADKRAKSGN